MQASQLQDILGNTPVTEFRYFDTIGSTNDEALAWLDSGAPDFALVIADEQTKGRGRFDRRWVTNPGAALAFSLILKISPTEKEMIQLFSPLCGLAIHDALYNLIGIKTEIKWPNDVLFNYQKFAGILVEATWMNADVKGVVLGIGINISPGSIPPAGAQLFPTTCLESALGRPINKFEVLNAILISIQEWRTQSGSTKFFKTWQDNLAFKGQRVRIEHSEKPSIIGIEKGINDQGNLVLILDDGNEICFEVGDVHLRLDEPPTGGLNA